MSKGGMLKAWHRFLQHNYNSFIRSAPNLHKQRKYEHIRVQQDFDLIEKERKLQRLSLIEYQKRLKQKLLLQKLDVMKNNQDLIEQVSDKQFVDDLKKAENIAKYENYQTFKQYSVNLEKEKLTKKLDQVSSYEAITKEVTIKQVETELQKIIQDLEEIQKTKNEIAMVEKKVEELEPDYVIVNSFDKKMILNMIAYYEFHYRNNQGIMINPETLKSMEIVHYHVEHNLPVNRQV